MKVDAQRHQQLLSVSYHQSFRFIIVVCAVPAMLFEAGIILGAHSEPVAYPVRSGSSHTHWPYLQLERTVNRRLSHRRTDELSLLRSILLSLFSYICLQCVDAVGWAAGRASSL